MTSARVNETNSFEIVTVYLIGEDGAFALNAVDNFEPKPTRMNQLDLIDLYNNQKYYPYQVFYGSPRSFHDPSAKSLAVFLSNKIISQAEHPDFHTGLFKVLNEFGDAYKGS